MELRHLRYFVAVAKAQSFRKAAGVLHISQPPLSQQIRNLEEELGTPLFTRIKNRIALTQAGKIFLEHAQDILSSAEEAREAALLAAHGKTGTLHVHFISSAITGTLQSFVTRFKKLYPLVDIRLSQSTAGQIMIDVESGAIDIGLVRLPVYPPKGITSIPVLRESYYVALPAAHKLTKKKIIRPEDLDGEPLIIYPRDTASGSLDDIIALLRKHSVTPHIVQEAPEQMTIAGLVASGLGYSVVPECMTTIRIPGVVHRPLAGGKNRTGIAIVAKTKPGIIAENFLRLAD